jgi:hypothetical protein
MYMVLNNERASNDIKRGLVHRVVDAEVYDWMYPLGTKWDAPIFGEARSSNAIPSAEQLNVRDVLQTSVGSPANEDAEAPSLGSNNWAVSGALTENGRAIVASDMHMSLQVPNVFYRARFVTTDADKLDVNGLTLPGAPIMAGSSILPMDMRRADLAYGSPEYALGGLGSTDYFNHIGLPSWTGAGCSDAHDLDLQAAAEVGSNMTAAALAGTTFIHNLGFLSGGRTGSLEMLVLCDELAGMVGRLAAGITVDEDAIALEVIKRAAADNAYLTDPHTFARYETEMWIPGLFERSDVSLWLETGSTPMRQRIKQKLHDLLAS